MPQIADHELGIDPKSVTYGLLYAVFGLGAALGAVSIGTVFASRDKSRMIRPGLIAFAILLALFAAVDHVGVAMLVVGLLGYAYFIVITSLSIVLQAHLEDAQRGRVTALWIMGFGGVVPLGVLVAGPFSDNYVRGILLVGVVWALLLAVWSSARAFRGREADA